MTAPWYTRLDTAYLPHKEHDALGVVAAAGQATTSNRTDPDAGTVHHVTAGKLQAAGMVTVTDGRITLTDAGRYHADALGFTVAPTEPTDTGPLTVDMADRLGIRYSR